MTDHANAIPLENGSVLTEDSYEVARVWITNGAGSSVWIHAGLLEEPSMFGYLMADTIRHAAVAYANTWDIDEVEALHAIVSGLAQQLDGQFTGLETIQKGGPKS